VGRAPIVRAFLDGELIVDSFAGGGGASTGIELALGRSPDIAINHDPEAIAMHEANHPETRHYTESVWEVDPVVACAGRPVGIAWFSPDCKHFSRAKGAPLRDQRIRGLAWVAVRWAQAVRPRVICLENVEEFTTWGPLVEGMPCTRRRGQTFRAFVRRLQKLGYVVDWRTLRASHYGAATSRKRLFLVARCDGERITWPHPTHEHCEPSAASIIDWSIPLPSIFERSRDLSPPTLARIAEGARRYARVPYLIHRGNGERVGQAPRTYDISKPLGTIVAQGQKHAVCFAFVAKHYSMRGDGSNVAQAITAPLGAITTRDHHALVEMYTADRVDHGAEASALLAAHGVELPYPVIDIGMRMLTPRELFRAQGFADEYRIDPVVNGKPLSKTAQIRMCGNSVSPPIAAAIVSAQFGLESHRRRAA